MFFCPHVTDVFVVFSVVEREILDLHCWGGAVVGLGLLHADMVRRRYIFPIKVINCYNFYGLVCRHMYSNNNHLVYNGYKVGIFYSRVYTVNIR